MLLGSYGRPSLTQCRNFAAHGNYWKFWEPMSYINGVNLLPSTGEFTYGTAARQGQRITESSVKGVNYYFNGSPSSRTDYSVSIDQLQAAFPACKTVALVCSWFCNSTNISACQIYPSTTYIGGSFQKWTGSGWVAENWQCSSLTQFSAGLIPISTDAYGSFTYGGTPSDQSLVECVQDLKARGLRVVFYPFILMDAPSKPWRGRITYNGVDVSSAAAAAVHAFLGPAAASQFTRDYGNKTVHYSGPATDWTYRRMILHYANLCVVAGGVDLFLLGSELRGLEAIRGPAWSMAGATDGSGNAVWDYPFVQGLIELSDDVRSTFDGAGLTKDTINFHNLISYSADWSDWMGYQHTASTPPAQGQWPHLDQLWAHHNIDLVCLDNYMPLSDWTTGTGGVDVLNWSAQAPAGSWPPSSSAMNGLGLSGTPTIYSKDYLKANIEGGEKFYWWYSDSNNLGRGFDPNGTDLQVSLPGGDRLVQSRQPFYSGQQILANKQIRWWWNNPHHAIYDTGSGWIPQGPQTEWLPQSKPIAFAEYGFPSNDKCTNQPNLFYSAGSTESGTAYWSIWLPADGGGFLPKRDQTLQILALQALYEYWFVDGHNATSGAGVQMIQPEFCSVWNWDARPFPVFPQLSNVWGDTGSWEAGNWLNGKGPLIMPPVPDPPPEVPMPFVFPSLPGRGWSVHKRPSYSTRVASHVSGREVRASLYAQGLYEFELTIEGLDSNGVFPGLAVNSLQEMMGLYIQCQGQLGTFLYVDPSDNTAAGAYAGVQNASGTATAFTLQRSLAYSSEPISWVTGISQIYVNGLAVLQYKLQEDSTNNAHYCAATDGKMLSAGALFTVACYVKAAERAQCQLQLYDGSLFHICDFDLIAATAVPGSGITAASIAHNSNGSYLISASCPIAAATTPLARLYLESSGSTIYTGTAGQGIYFSSLMYSCANVAAAFFPTIIASGSHATLAGPNWTVMQPNTLIFASAPAANANLTWDGTYAFNCRFLDDQEDFEEFMNGLWQVQSLKFRSVKP